MRKTAIVLEGWIEKRINGRKPDVIVGTKYLKRWHAILPENPFFNIYYHKLRASDLDRHLHDHPFFFLSFILSGGYYEHTQKGREFDADKICNYKGMGSFNAGSPWKLHRLEMASERGANTLFITGPKIRKWGFMTEEGWIEKSRYFDIYEVQP